MAWLPLLKHTSYIQCEDGFPGAVGIVTSATEIFVLGVLSAVGFRESFSSYLLGWLEASLTYLLRPSFLGQFWVTPPKTVYKYMEQNV